MIREEKGLFILETHETSYCFRVMETGQLEHLHYGRKLRVNPEIMCEKHPFPAGNGISYDRYHMNVSLEDYCLEMSGYGKGDIREPFVELVHEDGVRTTDFIYKDYEISSGKPEFESLPGSYGDNVEHLKITLEDKYYPVELELHYYVYEDCDVISRSSKLVNNGVSPIRVERLMSMQLDFHDSDLLMTTFTGGWIKEMNKVSQKLTGGTYVNSSFTGTSSNRANPFFMLSGEDTSEDYGDCYGLNLVYSGNHYEAAQIGATGKLRVISGIQPAGFSFILEEEDSFEAPEAVMCYSKEGFGGMSRQMHKFVRNHILRGYWAKKVRPILLNSWEAAYFDINEKSLIRLAKAGKDVGIELFVVDDGWFSDRGDETSSLGDWYPNKKKLPNGLQGIAKKVNNLGLDFGIWVEPEMVNVDSELYRAHPDWSMEIPGHTHSEGRYQRILDLANPDVQDYIIEAMSEVFSSANISYVKWDMNRIISDCYSQYLPAERQGEVAHRYVCGLYRCMGELVKRFPEILFEGCASGGNRFDLGMLCYFPQIWASDNSDAYSRAIIQNGYSYGYPMNTLTAHVSDCPNHQTLRNTPLHTRYNIASFGILGYECNLCDMPKAALDSIKFQIEKYKLCREVMQMGTFYRIKDFGMGDTTQWCVVSDDKTKAVGVMMQGIMEAYLANQTFRPKGLNPDLEYHFYNIPHNVNVKDFGSLINTEAPIHIKPGSLVHHIAAGLIQRPVEEENFNVYGDTLMYSGVKLAQPFKSLGYDDSVRFWKDFESRLYYMEGNL